MKSSFLLNALIVEFPDIDSVKKLNNGDLVNDSTLLTSLFAATDILNSTTMINNIKGYIRAIQGTTMIDIVTIDSVEYKLR